MQLKRFVIAVLRALFVIITSPVEGWSTWRHTRSARIFKIKCILDGKLQNYYSAVRGASKFMRLHLADFLSLRSTARLISFAVVTSVQQLLIKDNHKIIINLLKSKIQSSSFIVHHSPQWATNYFEAQERTNTIRRSSTCWADAESL